MRWDRARTRRRIRGRRDRRAGTAAAATTSYTDDEDGNVIRVTDRDGDVTIDTYDGAGDVTSTTVLDKNGDVVGSNFSTYDEDGNVTSTTDAMGPTVTDTDDDDDRLTSETRYNTDGTVADVPSYTYDAFGNITSETDPAEGGRLMFQGGEFDAATGEYHYGARDYEPAARRWTTQDPIGFWGGDPNLYRFVGNDPTSETDPGGREVMTAQDMITKQALTDKKLTDEDWVKWLNAIVASGRKLEKEQIALILWDGSTGPGLIVKSSDVHVPACRLLENAVKQFQGEASSFILPAMLGRQLKETIDADIKNLGSEDFPTRVKAREDLELNIEYALPALREATKSNDLEVALTANALVKRKEFYIELAKFREVLQLMSDGIRVALIRGIDRNPGLVPNKIVAYARKSKNPLK
jgi:RHS repeat-associated protein